MVITTKAGIEILVRKLRALPILLMALLASGCVTKLLANALSGPSTLTSDDDPELIRDAAPFGLKLMETVLQREPNDVPLLTSLAEGYTAYAVAFVMEDAGLASLEGHLQDEKRLSLRARKLLLRARGYALRGLEIRHPGITAKLESLRDLDKAVEALTREDVPLAYWAAASWALAISVSRSDMALVAQLPAPGALVRRAIALDESWGEGSLHAFQVSYLSNSSGEPSKEVRAAFDRAVELSRSERLGDFIAWAEGPLVAAQRRADFVSTLEKVRDSTVQNPKYNLANVIARRRAEALLAHVDELFN